MFQFLKRLNGCNAGIRGEVDQMTVYPSEKGATLATFFGDGGHEIPDEAIPLILEFFKRNPKLSHDQQGG